MEAPLNLTGARLSEKDLDFLIGATSPDVRDKARLREILRKDEDFRNSFIEDKRVFRRVMADEELLLKISPFLFFEILLRRAAHDMEEVGYTFERSNTMKIPVFDTKDVIALLKESPLLGYLAHMLSSFTRIQSYTFSFRARKGVWRKFRISDLDIHSLMGLCQTVDEAQRLGLYKRIADICLFILGLFPDYAERDYRYPFSGQLRPHLRGKMRISPAEYETEGRKFYRLAAEHQASRELDLSEVFWILHGRFEKAKKPLNFIAERYLKQIRHRFF